MDLKSDFCDKIIENCENCKLKNLKMNYEYDNWDKLINNEEWKLNDE